MSENNRDGLLDYSTLTDDQLEDHLQSIEAELTLIKAEQENRRNASKGEESIMELANTTGCDGKVQGHGLSID